MCLPVIQFLIRSASFSAMKNKTTNPTPASYLLRMHRQPKMHQLLVALVVMAAPRVVQLPEQAELEHLTSPTDPTPKGSA